MVRVLHRTAAPPSLAGRTLTRIGATAAFVILAASVAGQLVDYGVYDLRVRPLDAARDSALVNVLAGAGLLAAFAAACVVALGRRPTRRSEVALAAALGWLALDRMLGVHHHVPHWRLVYLPILGGTLLALGIVGRRLPRAALGLLVAAALLLAFSLVLHELGDWIMGRLGEPPDSWAYQLKVGLKHGTEAAGWILVAVVLGCESGVTRRSDTGSRRRSGTPRWASGG